MVKQPAWAAATSSSVFVPLSLSNRVLKEYGAFSRAPDSVEMSPVPDRPFPRQTATALRIMRISYRSTVHLPLTFPQFPAPEDTAPARKRLFERLHYMGISPIIAFRPVPCSPCPY